MTNGSIGLLASALALVLVACGGGSDGGSTASPGTDGGTGSLCDGTAAVTGCKMAWTGAETGSGDCQAFGSDTSLLVGTPTASPFANLIVRDFGKIATVGTYGLADVADALGGLSSDVGVYPYRLAKSPVETVGVMDLHLTSRDVQGDWHGFFRATAPGSLGNVGSVELCAIF
ncbi:hypothetical protein [Anaeromyxobacter oryzisoli]|uniref:hypothetical protein n=1 Tax=Anaeromyxobacter oryzisoli TaxID=2925408 RepID=UPI001F560623|nr:hypothetical protein [Anaeromyxobacter sp. SG63]